MSHPHDLGLERHKPLLVIAAIGLLFLVIQLSRASLEKRVRKKVHERCLVQRTASECEAAVELRALDCFEELHDRDRDSIDFGEYERCVLPPAEAPLPDGGTDGALPR